MTIEARPAQPGGEIFAKKYGEREFHAVGESITLTDGQERQLYVVYDWGILRGQKSTIGYESGKGGAVHVNEWQTIDVGPDEEYTDSGITYKGS